MGLKILRAAAEPGDDSDGDPPSDSGSSELSVESIGGLQPVRPSKR